MKGISDLIDSEFEQSQVYLDESSIISSTSDALNQPATKDDASQSKKPKKRHRVTMPKTKSRVAKVSPKNTKKVATKKGAGVKRKAVEEQIETEDLQNEANADGVEIVQQGAKPQSRSRTAAKVKTAQPTILADDLTDGEMMEIDQTPLKARSNHAPSRAGANNTKVIKNPIPSSKAKDTKAKSKDSSSQPQSTERQAETDNDDQDITDSIQPRVAYRPVSRFRPEQGTRRRAGSASDTERGDPNLRRKLGDITRKFENVDLKYRNLKETGINEANANMEKLRKQCESQTQAANDLIASLKKELATQAPLALESKKFKTKIQSQEIEATQLRKTATELASSLHSAQNEIKALQVKLAAARSSSANIEAINSRTPGSAIKANNHNRPVASGNTDVVQAAHVAQMKVDLYTDLTGLIVRSVKQTGEGDTYDCIQTGRNGTLHFKLYLDHEDAKSASFEETEFLYTPLLDSNRDREMMEIMPEYLTEDITFARQDAAKFYGRVVDTLTKRRTDE